MDKCPLNHIYLCGVCHRGDKGPHKNIRRDLELKIDLLEKLEEIFDKEKYTQDEIKEKLKISSNAVRRMCKLMRITVDKYDRKDILMTAMGGENPRAKLENLELKKKGGSYE